MSDKQIDHAQRIADRIQARNLALVPPTRTNAASPSMCAVPRRRSGQSHRRGSSSAAMRNTYTGSIWMCRTRTILGPSVCAQHSVVLQLDAARAVHQDPKARRDATTGQTTE